MRSTTASSDGRHSPDSSTMVACACPTMLPNGALRGIAIGRKNWTFAGSDEGGRRAAAIYTLIETAKLNDIDPQVWLADVLARLPDHPAKAHRRPSTLELAPARPCRRCLINLVH
jgi:IS66 C-terminal element